MKLHTPLPPMGLSVAVALLVGVSAVQLLPRLPPVWFSLCLLAPAAWVYSRRDLYRALGAFLLGAVWACAIGQWVIAQRLPSELSRTDFQLEGRVLGLPQQEEGSTRFDFHVESGSPGAPVGKKVRLGWYAHLPPTIEPGSRWRLLARLRRPQGVLNPGGFDFEESALAKRMSASGTVREPYTARLLRNGEGVDAWRDHLSGAIGRSLPEGHGRFVQALAVGDTRGLTAQDWETLRATGLTHQIAISGF
ncbi:MAG: ComEC/Rec2 family competence protein, partial [Arenimonas sp.]